MGKPAFLYIDYASTATVTATDTLAGKNVNNVLNGTEDENWKPATTSGTKTITIDFGSATQIDHTAFVGVNMDAVTLVVRVSSDNFASDNQTVFSGALSSDLNSAVVVHTSTTTKRYIKYDFVSNFDDDFAIAWIASDKLVELPYFENDWGGRSFNPEFKNLLSTYGIYGGNTTQRTMRNISLDWGQITPSEYTTISTWVTDRVQSPGSFVMIPDVDDKTENYFVWIEDNQGFEAPLLSGVHTVSPIRAKTRLA